MLLVMALQQTAASSILMYRNEQQCSRQQHKQEQHTMWCRINNAGSNAYKYGVLGDYSDAELINIVETNVLGVMLGCREVIV